jgi:hypothetical protein
MDAKLKRLYSNRAMFSMGDCFWMTASQRIRITNQYAGLDKVLNQTKILTRLQSVRAELAKLK